VRDKAAEARRTLDEGVNPIESRKRLSQPTDPKTFGHVATELMNGLEAGWRNAKHRQQWRNTLETYAKPLWNLPVADIRPDDVLAVLRPIWSVKEETASRVRGRIERVLDAAKARGMISDPWTNPARWKGNLSVLLPPRKEKGLRGHHAALPFDKIGAFMSRLRERPAVAARALELLILTAARTDEVRLVRWSEIDLDRAVWTVPASRMKMKREHRVPLSQAAVAVLRPLWIANADPDALVFPGQKPGRPMSNMAIEMLLRRLAAKHCTVHGFRSTFRDWAGECTHYPREIAEAALAHAVGDETERAYRRGDALARRRDLMEAWANYCAVVQRDKVDLRLSTVADPGALA
jgi:integrase